MGETLKLVLEICASIIASLGGATVIILAIVKLTSNVIAEKLEKKYQLKLDKELENHKSNLENKVYLTKTTFDLQIKTFQDLQLSYWSVVEQSNALITPGLCTKLEDKTEQEKIDNETYRKLESNIQSAQAILFSSSGFIPEDFYNLYLEIQKMGVKQCHAFSKRWNKSYFGTEEQKKSFSDEDYKRSTEMSDKLNEINIRLRVYISNLIII